MKPKISVVIPVYNGERYLAKAIDSVLQQDYPVHEIIAVDDGSTDGTARILRGYGDRLKVVQLNHQGVSNARNAGLRRAQGDYIAFLDHDDLWFKNKLKRQISDVTRHPEVGLFSSNYFVRYDGKLTKHFDMLLHKKNVNFDRPLEKNPFEALVQEYFIGTPSAVLIRRDVIDAAGGFDPNYRTCEDFDFLLRCSLKTGILLGSTPLLFKKSHDKNATRDKIALYSDHARVLRNTIQNNGDYIRRHRLAPVCNMALAEIHYFLGNHYYESGRVRNAFKEYFLGLRGSWSPKNGLQYGWTMLKKLIRFMSFDSLRRDKIKVLHNKRKILAA